MALIWVLHRDPLTEFSFFPRLPVEIRQIIWKFAIPEPRIVEVVSAKIPAPCSYRIQRDGHFGYPVGFSDISEIHLRFDPYINPREPSPHDRKVVFQHIHGLQPVLRMDTRFRTSKRGIKPQVLLHVYTNFYVINCRRFVLMCFSRLARNLVGWWKKPWTVVCL